MGTTVKAYPLHWPPGVPRKKSREFGRFGTSDISQGWARRKDITIAQAIERLQLECDRLGARNVILSSNLQLRLDGLPRSGQSDPIDPGVCLYFDLNGKPHAMPCDTYTQAAQNIAAIAAHIEATRAIGRYGVASVAQMFEGFAALPPASAVENWWHVFEINRDADAEAVQRRYRALAKHAHPDNGGSHDAMSRLNQALEAFKREREESK